MTVVLTGLLAGVLDALAALFFFLIRGNNKPGMLFQYIASAVFGPAAFTGGSRMVILGLFFHFSIAFCWVGLYFAGYPLVSSLGLGLPAEALVYGLLVWIVMNLVVLPLSRAKPRPFSISFVLINIAILIVTIGLPCAYAVRHFRR